MTKVTTVGIDLAKHVFSVHGVDEAGKTVLRRTVSRARLTETIAQLPPCLIGMEACTGAHQWAREFERLGHTVKLMAPKFVAPYRKSGKNDGNDAEAICEAVARPNMRFVPIKTVEQQAMIALHRVRQGYVEERTALINRIRAVLSEMGVVLPERAEVVRRQAVAAAEGLPEVVVQSVVTMREHLRLLDERIATLDRQFNELAKQSEPARRLMTIRGIGPITALVIVAAIGDGHDFKNGRQFAAWLGLTPRQYSSGGKTKLGRITKRGDRYIRTLLILGARAVLQTASRHNDRLSAWALSVRSRRGWGKAIVAIAAKNARICWAVLTKGEDFKMQSVVAASPSAT